MGIELQGMVALVTGASRGIGAATAKELARYGAAVVINYLQSTDQAKAVETDIVGDGGRAMTVQADVRDRAAVDQMVAAAQAEFGDIDILVNNANINFPMQPFADLAWADIQAKLIGELGAMVNCCQAVLPSMRARKEGRIILVSSSLSREPGYGFSAHCAAKAAMDSLARTMALELGPSKINVNVVGPGLTRTDATAFLPQEVIDQTIAHTPLRRVARPEDIARVIAFLASDMANYLTGQYIPVNGGAFMV